MSQSDDAESASTTAKRRTARMNFKNGESKSFYVTLIYAENPELHQERDAGNKVSTIIYITHNPLHDSTDHNQGTASRHRFGGKNAGFPCRIQQIIGPIDTYEEACEIREQWKSKSRGLPGRTDQGRTLAMERNLPCFDSHYDVDYSKAAQRGARKRKRNCADE